MARRRPDPKEEALRDARALNPRPEAVVDESSPPRSSSTPGTWSRCATRWCGGCGWRARRSPPPRRASGSPGRAGMRRPRPLDEEGLPGLLRARPGPRRAHKLSSEIVQFLLEALRGRTRPSRAGVGPTGGGILRVVGSSPLGGTSVGASTEA